MKVLNMNLTKKAWKEKELIDWVFNQRIMDNKPDTGGGK